MRTGVQLQRHSHRREVTTFISISLSVPFIMVRSYRLEEAAPMQLSEHAYGQIHSSFRISNVSKGGRFNRLPSHKLGMVVDRGHDFPSSIQTKLDSYGSDMWLFRDHSDIGTTRAINTYKGDHRRFSPGRLSFLRSFWSDQHYVASTIWLLEFVSRPVICWTQNSRGLWLCISYVPLLEQQLYYPKSRKSMDGPPSLFMNRFLFVSSSKSWCTSWRIIATQG